MDGRPHRPALSRADPSDRIGDASNVLVGCPGDHPAGDDVCTGLLSDGTVSDAHVIRLTTEPGRGWPRSWDAYVNEAPGALTVLPVGGGIERLGPAISGSTLSAADTTIEPVDDADELARMGTRLDEHLGRRDDLRPVLCVDSVDDLLAAADRRLVFRFLHLLAERVVDADGVAHYHLDPDTVDWMTVATFDHVVDAAVEVSDGEVTVRADADGSR